MGKYKHATFHDPLKHSTNPYLFKIPLRPCTFITFVVCGAFKFSKLLVAISETGFKTRWQRWIDSVNNALLNCISQYLPCWDSFSHTEMRSRRSTVEHCIMLINVFLKKSEVFLFVSLSISFLSKFRLILILQLLLFLALLLSMR